MRTETYVKNIASEFGGKVNKYRLETRLIKLLRMHNNELNEKKIDEAEKTQKKEYTPEQIQLKRDIFEVYVKRILESNKSDYVKMLDIIRIAQMVPGRYPMDIFVECHCFHTFFEHAKKIGIRYDETHFYT